MSYLKKIEYEIVPEESFSVIRNCSGCGRKAYFKNTKRFRVNANGNKLDVWLIYQCEKCRHTLNLTIYERQRPSSIPEKEYQCFLGNDEQLAEAYGRNYALFAKNKAEVDSENINYRYKKRQETTGECSDSNQVRITIQNPYGLKLRSEKQIAGILGLSRSQVKKLMEQEEIRPDFISAQSVSVFVDNHLWEQRGE
ncbi:MAG: DUF1062 domain-containing protein [Roseburia sp.]